MTQFQSKHSQFLTFWKECIPTSSEEQILQILHPAGVSLDRAPGPVVSSALR